MNKWTAALLTAMLAATGCKRDKDGGQAFFSDEAPAHEEPRERGPRTETAVSFVTDATRGGAALADEPGTGGASPLFDGATLRDAVGAVYAGVPGGAPGRGAQERLQRYNAAGGRVGPGQTAQPPLPDDYYYPDRPSGIDRSAGAGEALLGFVRFQADAAFETVAPVMSRLGWNARAPKRRLDPHSPERVTVHHTLGPQPMDDESAARFARNIQRYHMYERARGKFDDIGYHFLIAGHGLVIEGRPAGVVGAHAGGANTNNVGIAMMGDFNRMQPTPAQIESLNRLIVYLAIKHKRDPKEREFLEPHQHYTETACPGRNLLRLIDSLRDAVGRDKIEIISRENSIGAEDERRREGGTFMPLAVIGATNA